jgi:hypothetical protein
LQQALALALALLVMVMVMLRALPLAQALQQRVWLLLLLLLVVLAGWHLLGEWRPCWTAQTWCSPPCRQLQAGTHVRFRVVSGVSAE